MPTYIRITTIDTKCLKRWEKAGQPILREDGETYRMASGRNWLYLLKGQLKWNITTTESEAN